MTSTFKSNTTCKINGDPKCRCGTEMNPVVLPDPKETMRKLWTDHAVTNLLAIHGIIDGTDDVDAVVRRIGENKIDLGNELAKYAGQLNGDQFADLIGQHEDLAADALKKLKAGSPDYNAAAQKFFQQGDQVSAFLSGLYPKQRDRFYQEFREHVQFIIKLATLRKQRNFDEELKQYDAFFNHMMMFSDLLYCSAVGAI